MIWPTNCVRSLKMGCDAGTADCRIAGTSQKKGLQDRRLLANMCTASATSAQHTDTRRTGFRPAGLFR